MAVRHARFDRKRECLVIEAVANWIMFRRAEKLADRVLPFLPMSGLIADVGSGTGHNAVVFRRRSSCAILQFDVTDMHWVGEPPTVISDEPDTPLLYGREVACVLLIYVLQYPEDPSALLKRILNHGGPQVIVLQSTYRNRWGKFTFLIQEAVFGPIAFYLAALLRLIANEKCSVKPVRYFRADDVVDLLTQCGLRVRQHEAFTNWLLGTGLDLFLCEKEAA